MNTLADQLLQDNTDAQLAEIIHTLCSAGQDIAFRVSRGALANILGEAASENVQGETQKKLDILANDILKELLLALPQVAAIASEEEAHPVTGNQQGRFVVAFDPLDGSSNIDINGQIGTIFTIYKTREDAAPDSLAQFLQPGRRQVCAGFVLYGPACMLALTTGGPSRLYTLDNYTHAFVLTQSELRIAPEAREFAINMANVHAWAPAMQAYIAELQLGESGPRNRRFNMRWNGAMVGDVHRVLVRGGIFLYPSHIAQKEPNKLRLLYEANPMAMLVEHAGGGASTGLSPILDIQPQALHQRVSVVMGAAEEVQYVQQLLSGEAAIL